MQWYFVFPRFLLSCGFCSGHTMSCRYVFFFHRVDDVQSMRDVYSKQLLYRRINHTYIMHRWWVLPGWVLNSLDVLGRHVLHCNWCQNNFRVQQHPMSLGELLPSWVRFSCCLSCGDYIDYFWSIVGLPMQRYRLSGGLLLPRGIYICYTMSRWDLLLRH